MRNRSSTSSAVLIAVASIVLAASTAHAQPEVSRREYATPGLVVETGARRGTCDALLFTADGKYLLAAGDDKVVRNWKVDRETGLRNAEMPMLRWTTWHEKRGNIYAMALSPKDDRLVAIAGSGMTFGAVAILDRFDGTIKHGVSTSKHHQHYTVWSLAFSPSGKQLAIGEENGSVWVWDFQEAAEPRSLGKHEGGVFNLVRCLQFVGEQKLISAATNGEILEWRIPAAGNDAPRPKRLREPSHLHFAFALSGDGRWLAASSDHIGVVTVIDLSEQRKPIELRLAEDHYAQSLAFHPKQSILAVGMRRVDGQANFHRDAGSAIVFYDYLERKPKAATGPTPTYHPEALAFHPQHNLLAVAGGNDHEVTLWDLDTLQKVGREVRGPGSCLWSVALSADSRFLGFKDQRDAKPKSPNERGDGEWRVFDLHQRKFAPSRVFKPLAPITETGGWKLHTMYPQNRIEQLPAEKRTDSYMKSSMRWFVEGPNRTVYELPLDRLKDSMPRCYAFLPETEKTQVRLAVGHLWGVTLFELTAHGPRVVRRMVGHEGEVMALAVSQDQKRLVTVSRDQTVAGWSLEDWPYSPELGASFTDKGKAGLFVNSVAPGSPAWETGLSAGDEIVLLALGGSLVFNKEPFTPYKLEKKYDPVGTPPDALKHLQRLQAGVRLYLGWKSPNKPQVRENETSVIQRPLWRFFPTRDNEWVLWRWRDFFYDTSTNGDALIGWQRNSYDINRETPTFYKAEQFRKRYHRPDLIATMLKNWNDDPRAVAFPDLVPPQVRIDAKQTAVVAKGKNQTLTVTLTALPDPTSADHKTALDREPRENQQLKRVILWINDCRVKEWSDKELKLQGGGFQRNVAIPVDLLRAGDNVLTLQSYNKADVRGESAPVHIKCERVVQRTLYGVFVGVGDYRRSNPRQRDLQANKDAEAMYHLWRTQRGKLYDEVSLFRPLLDGQATRENILKLLDSLKTKVKPDDRLVFFMAGHGTRRDQLQKMLKLPDDQVTGLGSFIFCCGNFNVGDLYGTTINFEELHDKFADLPCHKLILLDACHSGIDQGAMETNPANPVRVLTQHGIGPIILAACQPDQVAFEARIDVPDRPELVTYGLFATAVRRTTTTMFATADKNRNRDLEPAELRDQVQAEVQRLLRRLRDIGEATPTDQQNPIDYIPARERDHPLITRPPG